MGRERADEYNLEIEYQVAIRTPNRGERKYAQNNSSNLLLSKLNGITELYMYK